MKRPRTQYVETNQGTAYVIDGALEEDKLRWIDNFRCSLPLNSKRPTVDRRFFADGPESLVWSPPPFTDAKRPIARTIENALGRALTVKPPSSNSSKSTSFQTSFQCHVFRYQRFLEYTKSGSKLDPHTDGNKVCDETQITSTHTLLLYMNDCQEGGQTLLMSRCTKSLPETMNAQTSDDPVLFATQPKRGRILLFPHATPHAGAKVVSLPKICLRAEVTLREEENKVVGEEQLQPIGTNASAPNKRNDTTKKHPLGVGILWQTFMFWSLFLAIPGVPLWMLFGRGLFGVEDGWNGLILFFTWCPLAFVYHIVIFAIAYSKNEAQYPLRASSFWNSHAQFQLSSMLCVILLIYYLLQFFFQLFMEDGGLSQPSQSAVELAFGTSKAFNSAIASIIAWATGVLAMVLALLIWREETPSAVRTQGERFIEDAVHESTALLESGHV